MDQERIAKCLKDIRKKHNLTQKQFADKYNVTYQAVSKWENGLNMPDTLLMRQICKDFNISLDELLDGKYQESMKKSNVKIIIILFIAIIGLFSIIIYFQSKNKDDFQFKTLSSECENFNISGNISYNDSKSAIYITNIEYCGGDDAEKYKSIECVLYETNNNIEVKISTFKSTKENITLEEFLKDVTLSIDNHERTCKEYQENSLYLSINATNFDHKIITYKIPLKLESCDAKR